MIKIDVERFEVKNGKREIKMTPKQFDLLAILAKADGRVVSYEDILKQLWGDWPTTRVAVNQVIFRIRKSIQDKRGAVILTVRNRGFKARGVRVAG